MSFVGRMKDGVIVFDSPVTIPDGTEVRVELMPAVEREEDGDEDAENDGPSLYESLKDIIGQVKGKPADWSVNHDHYLYGRPKQQP